MKTFKTSILAMIALGIFSTACIEFKSDKSSSKNHKNYISNSDGVVNQLIGDDNVKLHVLSQNEYLKMKLDGKILDTNSIKALSLLKELPSTSENVKSLGHKTSSANSLVLGFPMGLVGEQSIFGAVITKVSDKTSETLGGLKLTDLSPLHVTTMISFDGTNYSLALVGCSSECDETSKQEPLMALPIVSVNEELKTLYLDLSVLGSGFDLITLLDPDGEYTKLTAVSAVTTTMDYSFSTLVFDVLTTMVPVGTTDANAAPKTEFTVRWYLKLNSAFNPAFTPRPATEGVGFFKTERSASPKITRFSSTDFGKTVKYYIKNVPAQHRPAFALAFDNWNVEFNKIIGRNLLSYEFIETTDPRYNQIVAGDIRYNVLEWDLDNVAGYGGLGPSIANQFTGETLAANVLIQGPTVITLYTEWFRLSQIANKLLADGKVSEANAMIADFNRKATAEMEKRNQTKFALKFGDLTMTVHAQKEELEDPMIKRSFEIVPAGMTFDNYMSGYFTDMLSHELGHNLGLRHNFKGNLGAYEGGEQGSVSRSVMEYLGRPFRYLDVIGQYDRMAISYGYRGVAPKHLDWFCTDEDQGSDKETISVKSAECTKSDATSDPFSFWERRLARVIDLIVDTHSSSAPVWMTKEVTTQINETSVGLMAYAASAEKTAATWTNFFGKGQRPERDDVKGIKEFVLSSIKKKLCSPTTAAVIASKESAEAIKLAQDNMDALKKAFESKAVDLAVFTVDQLKCE